MTNKIELQTQTGENNLDIFDLNIDDFKKEIKKIINSYKTEELMEELKRFGLEIEQKKISEVANMKTETIYETYTRTLCSNCKNRKTNLCEIRTDINGIVKCCYYIKDKDIEGYKKPLIRLANQSKPLMKLNI